MVAYTSDNVPTAINRVRIEWAKDKLAAGDALVKVIARDCGYERESDFDYWFRRLTGRTPTEWRRHRQRRTVDWRQKVRWEDPSEGE